MQYSMSEYEAALKAFGFDVVLRYGRVLWLVDECVSWHPAISHPRDSLVEAAVRSAVLKVAPGSFAQPDHMSPRIAVDLVNSDFDFMGSLDCGGRVFGPDYTSAWLNALVALHKAGYQKEER